MSGRGVATLAALCLSWSCQSPSSSPSRQSSSPSPSEARAGSSCAGKPEAPVDAAIHARNLGGDMYELRVEAVPRGDVDFVLLELINNPSVDVIGGSERAWFGATVVGMKREMVARVRLAGPGAVVEASARVGVAAGFEPNRMVRVALGAPVTKQRAVTRVVVPGDVIDEVGP